MHPALKGYKSQVCEHGTGIRTGMQGTAFALAEWAFFGGFF